MSAVALPLLGDPSALWYLNRATGLVLLVLFSLALLLGQLATARNANGRIPRFVTLELHRNITLVALGLLVLHVLTAVIDDYVDISLLDAVVPARSPYRPVWLALGTLAVDLLIVIGLTTLVRHRIPYRTWRFTHYLAYACWPLAVVHGLGTGTDTRKQLVLVVTFGCVALVLFGLLIRLASMPGLPGTARLALGALVVAMPLLASLWLRTGPLQPDWSRRAGTPPPANAPAQPPQSQEPQSSRGPQSSPGPQSSRGPQSSPGSR
jgi:methionine sulfoxide reductase heme-binding subunit